MNNIFNSGHNGIAIQLKGIEVTINGNIYKDPICIARLLSMREIERLDKFNTTTPESRIFLDEEIVSNVFESFLGISDLVNWQEMEAGIVTTIANAVKLKSIEMISDPERFLAEYESTINVYNSIQAIVARFMATPFSEVENLPINELLRRYAICIATYPEEVKRPGAE